MIINKKLNYLIFLENNNLVLVPKNVSSSKSMTMV